METKLVDVDKCLFMLTFEDAQFAAKDLIGRELTMEELQEVRKGIEWGMDSWPDVMRTAIFNVTTRH